MIGVAQFDGHFKIPGWILVMLHTGLSDFGKKSCVSAGGNLDFSEFLVESGMR
jgi:hypothetical protein